MNLGQDFLLIIMNRKETEGKAPEKELKVNSSNAQPSGVSKLQIDLGQISCCIHQEIL